MRRTANTEWTFEHHPLPRIHPTRPKSADPNQNKPTAVLLSALRRETKAHSPAPKEKSFALSQREQSLFPTQTTNPRSSRVFHPTKAVPSRGRFSLSGFLRQCGRRGRRSRSEQPPFGWFAGSTLLGFGWLAGCSLPGSVLVAPKFPPSRRIIALTRVCTQLLLLPPPPSLGLRGEIRGHVCAVVTDFNSVKGYPLSGLECGHQVVIVLSDFRKIVRAHSSTVQSGEKVQSELKENSWKIRFCRLKSRKSLMNPSG